MDCEENSRSTFLHFVRKYKTVPFYVLYLGGIALAKKSMIAKAKREPKYSTRSYTRCNRCGRPHSVYRKFGLCRVWLREMALKGELPGVRKASW